MLHDMPEWARPAAKTGLILGFVSVFLFGLASFLACVVPSFLKWAGDGPLFVLLVVGGLLFITAQVCAMVIYLQGVARGKWR
jgi:hypothetical protein